jgi:hypothetical protein
VRALDELRVLLDHALEQPDAARERLGHRGVGFLGEHFDGSNRQAVGLHAPLEDAEALLAARGDLQHAELRHVPGGDAREGADCDRRGRRADLGALADEAHAEGRLVLEAGLRHLHVALLENAQREPAAREKHRVQREQRKKRRQRF